MFKIRPHHLMCMQAYIGKGYSKDFIENMDFIVKSLKENQNQIIQIVGLNDDICTKCPNNINGFKCSSNDKVLSIDGKIVKLLDLKMEEYNYKTLLEKLRENFSEEKFKEICGKCQWYKYGICEKIFKEKGFI